MLYFASKDYNMGKKQQQKDSFGERMKAYENVNRTYLTDGVPKVIRLDGRAFHTFLKNARRPYDPLVIQSMIYGAVNVMKTIGGTARFAYIQSDEVSIGINDKPTIESQPWFGNNVQKMVSISAAVMSVNFSGRYNICRKPILKVPLIKPEDGDYFGKDASFSPAYFDARIFQVPSIIEMHNAILWRQQDASKNSISQYARHFFSHKELEGKNGSEMQDMMHSVHKFNWNDAPTWTKRGVLLYRIDRSKKDVIVKENPNLELIEDNIVVDWGIPKFSEKPTFLSDIYLPAYLPQENNEA